MFEMMAKTVRNGILTLLVFCFSACSSVQPRDSQDGLMAAPELRRVDAPALDGHNLISYDVYAMGNVLHALFAAESDTPKKPFVGYLRSEDGGLHWTETVEIGRYVPETMESAAGNDIQVAASGDNVLAIWQVTGEIPGMGPLRAVYSTDSGASWKQGLNPAASEIDQSHPDLLADADGRFHLVWLDDRDENGYQGIRYARTSDAGQDWELAQTIDESTCSCCWNRLLMGQDRQIDVLYRDMEPRDMALALSKDGGQSWRRLSTVGEFNWQFDGCPHNGGALAWAGQTLHALAWTGAENMAGLYHLYSTDNGTSWSPPQRMGGESLAFHSDIAAASAEHVLAIWDARGADGSAVMISESVDGGKHWSAAQRLSSPGSSAQFPRMAATANGVLALWVEQMPGGNKQWMSAIFK
ncbi:MAG: sialidase family protein [Methylomonas sp.]|nr:sialidase family protein [Methylomonas sp.]